MSINTAGTADILDAVGVVRRALSRAAASAFSGTGVGPKQVQILREIRSAGKIAQVDLSRATSTDPAGLMRVIDALESRGWLRRTSTERDRRRKLVALTPAGLRAMNDLERTYDSLRRLTNGALNDTERRQFCSLAAKVAVTLESAAAAPVEQSA